MNPPLLPLEDLRLLRRPRQTFLSLGADAVPSGPPMPPATHEKCLLLLRELLQAVMRSPGSGKEAGDER